MAVADVHMSFVAHDYCQQALRTCWLRSDLTGTIFLYIIVNMLIHNCGSFSDKYLFIGDVLPWSNANYLDKILYVMKSIIFLPLNILLFLVLCTVYGYHDLKRFEPGDKPRYEGIPNWLKPFITFFTVPMNRFIASMMSQLFYLFLMILVILNPLDKKGTVDVDFYDYLLPIFTFAFLCEDINLLIFHFKLKSRKGSLWYALFYHAVIFIGTLMKTLGFVLECLKQNHDFKGMAIWEGCIADDPALFDKWKSPVIYGYGLLGVGIVMGTLRILHYSQLIHSFGPLIISIKSIYKDVILLTFAYLIFLVSFTLGISFILELTRNEPCLNENPPGAYDADTPFSNVTGLRATFKAAFWSLYEPGHPGIMGCSTGFPRYLGMAMWGLFQFIIVIVLLNILIAMMNATMASIQREKIEQWKFARTEIWLKYFDKQRVLPIPFNLIELAIHIVSTIYRNFMGRSTSEIEKKEPQR